MTIFELQELYYKKLHLLEEFCSSNGLSLFPVGGTLLGIILYNDFIPWDDDLDLAMPRIDYEALYTMRKQLRERGLIVERYKCSPNFPYPYIKILFEDCISTHIKDQVYGFCGKLTPAFDLYPIDAVGDTKDEVDKKLRRVNVIKCIYDVKITPVLQIMNPFKRMAAIIVHMVPLQCILAFYDRCMARKAGMRFVTRWRGPNYEKHVYEASLWSDTVTMQFKSNNIACPAGYDEILRDVYGDYTKPYIYDGKMRHDAENSSASRNYFSSLRKRFK